MFTDKGGYAGFADAGNGRIADQNEAGTAMMSVRVINANDAMRTLVFTLITSLGAYGVNAKTRPLPYVPPRVVVP
jgi:hypothetical protein